MTLDALEYVQIRNGMRDRRAQLAHLQLVDPADMSRFNRLGAIASVQTLWTAAREEQQQLYRDLLGAERTARNYPFRSLRNAGAMLAAGSDWSVSTMDPMQIIQTGVTHLLIDQPDSPPWNPHERLDLLTMLEAYTVNTAYALRFDDCTGSLEAGKDASFAILDRNPFAHPVETFAQTRVIETCFRGEVVRRAGLGGLKHASGGVPSGDGQRQHLLGRQHVAERVRQRGQRRAVEVAVRYRAAIREIEIARRACVVDDDHRVAERHRIACRAGDACMRHQARDDQRVDTGRFQARIDVRRREHAHRRLLHHRVMRRRLQVRVKADAVAAVGEDWAVGRIDVLDVKHRHALAVGERDHALRVAQRARPPESAGGR